MHSISPQSIELGHIVQSNRARRQQAVLMFLIVATVVTGVFFRFIHLDRKVYWWDEVYTSLRVSGYREAEIVREFENSRLVSIDYFKQKYQQATSDKTVAGTIEGLQAEEPQLAPLYFIATRFWAERFGSSVGAIRSLSAVFSLLAFPGMYWLCLELFSSRLTACIAVMVLAVSPLHLAFAHEARPYSLWTGLALCSSAALLRAIRLKTKASWFLYALTLVISFYTFLLSALLAIGHGVYVLVLERFRLSKTVSYYIVSSLVSALLLLPWLINLSRNWSRARSAVNINMGSSELPSLSSRILGWFRLPARLVFDVDFTSRDSLVNRLAHYSFSVFSLLLVVTAAYAIYRTTPRSIWLFVLTLVGTTWLGLYGQDLILKGQGGRASGQISYLLPCFLGSQIAITHLFVDRLTRSNFGWQRRAWQAAFAVLLSAGIFSGIFFSSKQAWWSKGGSDLLRASFAAANLINQSEKPLLITNAGIQEIGFYSHLLDPKVQVLVQYRCGLCSIEPKVEFNPDLSKALAEYSDVFLFPDGTGRLFDRLKLQTAYQFDTVTTEVPVGGALRRIKQKAG